MDPIVIACKLLDWFLGETRKQEEEGVSGVYITPPSPPLQIPGTQENSQEDSKHG